MLNKTFFRKLLEQADAKELAPHSRRNHHVNGMDYLCLHRTDGLTVKLYLVEEPKNPHSGYLVHPHSHRYAFGSIVLAGALEHHRFRATVPSDPDVSLDWSRYRYNPDTGRLTKAGAFAFDEQSVEKHRVGGTYWVGPDEIHTLRLRRTRGPVLIGLVQMRDERKTSDLYLPVGTPMETAETRQPTTRETRLLAARCLQLLDA